MVYFGTHLPRRDLSWVTIEMIKVILLRFSVPVINSSMEPMSIVINVMRLIVSEFIKWMMFQIVDLYIMLHKLIILIMSSSVGAGSSTNLFLSSTLELSNYLGGSDALHGELINECDPPIIAMLVLALKALLNCNIDIFNN